jgi:membrane-anchored glycerophosphoryl diester phosphodiesterase (GDPDase)
MTLGTILSASFRVLRRNPRPTFGLALLIESITIVASAAVLGLVFVFAFSRVENATSASSADTISNGAVGLLLLAYLVPITLGVFGLAITQGVFAMEVARGTIGERLTLRGLWRQSKGRLWPLIGWLWAVVGTAIVLYIVFILIIVLAAAIGGVGGVTLAIVFGILGGLGAIALVLWLYTKLSLVPAALLVERLTLGRAIARSWSLTRGYFWRTLGIELLVLIIINVATSVVTAPLEIVFLFVSGLFNQTGDHTTAIVIAVILGVVTIALTVVVGAVSTVVQSSTTALLYIDLRMRKEALDLQLIRYVEARQIGDGSISDPYAT